MVSHDLVHVRVHVHVDMVWFGLVYIGTEPATLTAFSLRTCMYMYIFIYTCLHVHVHVRGLPRLRAHARELIGVRGRSGQQRSLLSAKRPAEVVTVAGRGFVRCVAWVPGPVPNQIKP